MGHVATVAEHASEAKRQTRDDGIDAEGGGAVGPAYGQAVNDLPVGEPVVELKHAVAVFDEDARGGREQPVRTRADLRAERAIGMHWGTFEGLTDEPLDEPPRILAQQRQVRGLLPAQFDVMKIGETRRLQKSRPP